ncbi:MAG: GerW family sporulation protein [Eubacteriales bacterium]|nr:GerW family sporulation protein [Eubacteriales bacterium]
MEGANGVLTSKTVVGEPVIIGETIIIPLSDVSIGVGAGSNGAERKDSGMGGFSAKMSPTAVLIIKNDIAKVVNVKDQTSLTHVMDMIPEVIDKIRSRDKGMISDEEAVSAAFPEKTGATVETAPVPEKEGAAAETASAPETAEAPAQAN